MIQSALTPRQSRFVDEYLIDLNGTQAAIRAGYSPKTAVVQASRLLTVDKVESAVEARRREIAEHCEIDAEWVLSRLAFIAETCIEEGRSIQALGALKL